MPRLLRSSLCLVSTLGLPLTVLGQSQSATDSQAANPTTLSPLVVTAALVPQTADNSLASVTTLSHSEMVRNNPISLTNVLRSQPGVDISNNGGPGTTSNVYIRGASSQASTLLIDGIRLRSATTGSPAYQYLDPAMFSHAELVRGPRGSLYGADAAGGVIQLFTDGEQQPGIHPYFETGFGSQATYRQLASLSGQQDGTRFTLAASHLKTNGQRDRRGGKGLGYANTSVLFHLTHDFSNGVRMGGLLLRARGHNHYDGGTSLYAGKDEFVQQVAGIYAEAPLGEYLTSRLTLSQANDKLTDMADGTGASRLNTRTQSARWQNTLRLGQQRVIAGAEYTNDKVTGTQQLTHHQRYNRAVFTQGLFRLAPFSLQASLRHDDNQAFGGATTGGLALGYALDNVHTFRASYGTAFRVPTFNDLYWPDQGFYRGNPDLKPEKSNTTELGIHADHGSWYWDLAAYQSHYRDLINYSGNDYSHEVNVGRARVRGIELSSGIHPGRWDITTGVTYLRPENRATGKVLQNRARQTARLDIDRHIGSQWTLGGSWIAQGSRFSDTDNKERLGGFSTFDMRAAYRFMTIWELRASIENLANKHYQTSRGYLEPGRTAMLTLAIDPGRQDP